MSRKCEICHKNIFKWYDLFGDLAICTYTKKEITEKREYDGIIVEKILKVNYYHMDCIMKEGKIV